MNSSKSHKTNHKQIAKQTKRFYVFKPIPLAADDNQCTTNANLLHLCATMLPFLAKYDRDDLCSGIVHRMSLTSKDKFSVVCIDRKHRCDTLSVDGTDSPVAHWFVLILAMVVLVMYRAVETSKCPRVEEHEFVRLGQ